ncbi:capsular polysaccharide export protein [Rheinheimera pacifica]|uniref:capsular polysaccharide biosynthesis protein n=1 Tax=Rheinheimera pacifica TaxID=173990 RepID=UPI00285B949A|nr:capsular polysaccharide biosynthesis protein [Rheinheimera pacifica]MDR6984056.1 capsular polysaccharide export protein [Rheinheimera pacifica]
MAFRGTQLNLSATATLLTPFPALAAIPALAQLLGVKAVKPQPGWFASNNNAGAVLAWGRKPSAVKAERLAQKLKLPLLRLEDGFIRSVGLGSETPPLSIVLDDVGIYYDASAPSRLEYLIRQPLTSEQLQRAQHLIAQWQQLGVSKYNHSPDYAVPQASRYVLVVDQTFGDAAIAFGQASAASFTSMLDSALERYPEHQILLKIHPDVFAGKKQGHFSALSSAKLNRVTLLATDVHPASLLKHAEAVFCVTSQMGFEALLWQKPVYTFGMPFYAGWGLTTDALPAPDRRCNITLEQLVYAALVEYPRYLDPETGQRCEPEQLMAWLALQRYHRHRFSQPLYLRRPPYWKKAIFQRFFQGASLHVVGKTQPIADECWQVVWGAQSGEKRVRVEDGFIRSVGLGADLIRPASWVLDDVGMYYDASSPSALENILSQHEFTQAERDRAAKLIQRMLTLKMTKYNIGLCHWQRPAAARVILVPGQVESDASIRLGSPLLKTNLALLQAVREANPDAYVVYKPHPDVQAGLRLAGEADGGAARQFCDEIVGNEDMAHLLGLVDEVHTLTSLTGFEALMREVTVVCYGQPFYAGWGLTRDCYPPQRRQRKLQLTELIAATLMLYPTYISNTTNQFTTPERVIAELEQQRRLYKEPGIWRRVMRVLQRRWRF